MIPINTFGKLTISFPEVTVAPHFEKTSFSVKKRIFAAYDDIKMSLYNVAGN